MRHFALALVLGVLFPSIARAAHAEVQTVERPPNVVIFLADDLGFSDFGCYGGEISTPHVDRLAAQGIRFSQFYNTARCWPTRASLLTGYYAQQVRRDALPGGSGGSTGRRPAWAALVSQRLRQQGYKTYHAGKWHVDGKPTLQGFDHSYHLEDTDRQFSPRAHFLDDQPLPPVEPGTSYYATDAIAEHAVQMLREHAASGAGNPFFQYVAFISPHFPLQAPADEIARDAGLYAAGWDQLRAERWQRQQSFGVFPGQLSPFERQRGAPYAFPNLIEQLGPGEITLPSTWSELTTEQQRFQAQKMVVHAAMVRRMDSAIGRVLDQLRDMGELDRTLVLVLSDNGASAELMVRGEGHDRSAPAGSARTFLCLGPGWSTLANTPFRRHKTWVHEGGIATPCIAHWPAGLRAKGTWTTAPAHVIDVVPTLLELAHITRPNQGPALVGQSFAPVLRGDEGQPHPRELWWLHEGNRALRSADWKLVANRDSAWELYDLSVDRSETHNLADEQPDRVHAMAARWEALTEQFRRDAAEVPQ